MKQLCREKTGSIKSCVVIVTYGNRWCFLRKVLTALAHQTAPIECIIIVNNGATDINLPELTPTFENVVNVSLPKNIGSSGGYALGIKEAMKSNVDFVWFLDDDNVPEPDALERLLITYYLLGEHKCIALSSQRYVNGMVREPGVFLENQFLNFHIKKMFCGKKELINGHSSHRSPPLKLIDVAPYGGLFMHIDLIKKIGLPNADFVTYVDDIEYTMRISSYGCIYRCMDSRIHDTDISWNLQCRNYLTSKNSPNEKIYYSIRNGVYLSFHNIASPLMFLVNLIIGLSSLTIKIFTPFPTLYRAKRFLLICRAIRDGFYGNMGLYQ